VEAVHYAALLGVDVAQVRLTSGQRHDVVINESADVAWRFPRTAEALSTFDLSAERFRAAAEIGLAPAVVEVVTGPLGTARMGTRLVRGTGMSGATTEGLGPRARARLVRDLVALLGGLRSVQPPSWPGSDLTWAERWALLTERLRSAVVPLIGSADGRRRAETELTYARRAAQAPGAGGLVHGDLGGENVVIDPLTGEVTGVLDWDDAGPGDPAVDLAAIRAHAPTWLTEGLFTADPTLGALRRRADAYLATFPLQQALWGLESGDDAEVDEGLADYLSPG
jgi:aminoglycoside 2''-phosphotransferase